MSYLQTWVHYDVETMLTPGTGVHWCEPKYVVSNHIAEFFNTISNLFIIILPFIGLYLQKEYFEYNKMAKIAFMSMCVVGIMSTYYHSTLSLTGQILDELSIFWGVVAAYVAFLPASKAAPDIMINHVYAWRVGAVIFTIICSLLCFLLPAYNNLFMIAFLGIPAVFTILLEAKHTLSDDPVEKKIGQRAMFFSGLAMVLWILDKCFCSLWLHINFPYLHAAFHVGMGFGCYDALVLYSYLDAKEHMANDNCIVTIKWAPEVDYVPGILPYVHLQHKQN